MPVFDAEIKEEKLVKVEDIIEVADLSKMVFDPEWGGYSHSEIYKYKISWTAQDDADKYYVYGGLTPFYKILIKSLDNIKTDYEYFPPILPPTVIIYFWVSKVVGTDEIFLNNDPVYSERFNPFKDNPFSTFRTFNNASNKRINKDMKYMFEEIRRRDRWQLENDGEEAYLYMRRWTGFPCITPDSEILTSNLSYKKIPDLIENMEVITHTGNKQKIKNITKRFIDEDILNITTIYNKNLKITSEHPVLTIPREEIMCRKHKRKGNYCNNQQHWICKERNCHIDISDTKRFILAKNLKVGDYILFPIPIQNPISFIWSNKFARLVGYFIAEGCVNFYRFKNRKGDNHYRVIFSLHKKELSTIGKEIIDLVKEFYNKKPMIYIKKNNLTITFCSKSMYVYFSQFGKKENKILNNDIMNMPEECLYNFIGAWLNGDGCYITKNFGKRFGKSYLKLSTCSFKLAQQSEILLMRLGIIPHVIKEEHYGGPMNRNKKTIIYNILIGSRDAIKFINYTKFNILLSNHIVNYKHVFLLNKYIAYPIKKIIKQKYIGFVYNLEVEDDNSYIVNGLCVHNCQCTDERASDPDYQERGRCVACLGTGILAGYYPKIKIRFRYEGTPKKVIKYQKYGYAMIHDITSWMLWTPKLRNFDILIRLKDNNRFLIDSPSQSEQRGVPFRQSFNLKALPLTDIRYQITDELVYANIARESQLGWFRFDYSALG